MKLGKKALCALGVLCAALFVLLAGCQEAPVPVDPAQVGLMSAVHTSGRTISVGDTRSLVEKVCGSSEKDITDWVEEKLQRVEYWDVEGIAPDYRIRTVTTDQNGDPFFEGEKDDQVMALILRTPDWRLANGITFGMPKEELLALFEKQTYNMSTSEKSLTVSLDENGAPISFDEDSPCMLQVSFEQGIADFVRVGYRR